MELVALTCAKCGGPLQFEKRQQETICLQCGTGYLVNELGGAFGLTEMVGTIVETRDSFSRTASEMALVRLEEEVKVIRYRINSLISERKALEKSQRIALETNSTKSEKEQKMTVGVEKTIGNIFFVIQILLILLSGVMIVENGGVLWFLLFGVVVIWWLLSSSGGSKKGKEQPEEQDTDSIADSLTAKAAEFDLRIEEETSVLNEKLAEVKFHQDNVRLKA